MNYVLDLCIISFVYLGLTAGAYALQRKLHILRARLYGWLVGLALLSLVFDVLAAAVDPVGLRFPLWALYAVNIVFLLCVQLSGPIFLLYTLVLTGRYPRMQKAGRALVFAPFALSAGLLLSSPFWSHGVFVIDAAHTYQHADAYLILYAAMGLYLITSAVLVTVSRRGIRRNRRLTIYSFLLLTVAAMLVQMSHPQFLVNSTANALALIIMYYSLESPSRHIDPLTRLFNRAALPVMLTDLYEQNQPFSVLLFPLDSFHLINYALGIRRGDEIMIRFAAYLQRAFPAASAVRVTGDVYAVVDPSRDAPLTHAALSEIVSAIPQRWTADDMETQLSVKAAGINSADYPSPEALLDTVNDLVARHESGAEEPRVQMADGAYRKAREEEAAYETALEHALSCDRIAVHYQPIHDAGGRLVALEALCRITDPVIGPMRPDIFIAIAERNGGIVRLGELVLQRVCAFIREYGVESWGLEHIGVNLSVSQCIKPGTADALAETVRRASVRPGIVSFEITETAATSSLPVVRQTMLRLCAQGFRFLLDDFGSGYANFGYLADLPFHCVKIDRDILWTAMKSDKQMAFLEGVVRLTDRLGLQTVCEGVETEAQASVLRRIGVTMQQGFLYARALPPAEMYAYAVRCGVAAGKGGDGQA